MASSKEPVNSTEPADPTPEGTADASDQQTHVTGIRKSIWARVQALQLGAIRTRLPISFVLVALVPVIVISAMLVVVGSRNGRQQAFNQLESVAKIKEAEVRNWISDLQSDLDAALSGQQAQPRAIALLQTTEPSESQAFWMRSHLQQVVAQAARLDELSLVGLDGQVALSTDITQEGEDYSTQIFFQPGLRVFYLQPPAYDPSGDNVVMFIAEPVVGPEEEAVGLLAGRINIDTLSTIMGERAWLGETGEGLLVDRNQVLLTAPRFGRQEEAYVRVEDGASAIQTQGDGSRSYSDYRGVPVLGVYRWLPELQTALVIKQDQSEALSITYSMLTIIGFVALGAVVIATMTSLFASRGITAPLSNLADTAAQIATGDLERRANVERADEIGALAQAFNSMTTRLREMLQDEQQQREYLQATIDTYMDYMAQVEQGNLAVQLTLDGNGRRADDPLIILGHQLTSTVTNLQRMVIQIRGTAENLNSAVAEILAAASQQASGANEQAAAISQTTTTVDEVKTISEQSVARAQDVLDVSQRTVQVSRSGQQAVDQALANMRQIKARVESIAENILALAEQAQQVGEIISTVNDIASQSNILALNASVEAARAGEHGKGFAVVAVEVRNLAEQSKQATAQVRTILSEIQNGINGTVMATEEGTKVVEEGLQLAAQTGEVIEQLALAIEESAQAATQMTAGGRQQASGVEQIAVAMQNINQATAQSLASTRQTENAAQQLNDLAGALSEIITLYQQGEEDS